MKKQLIVLALALFALLSAQSVEAKQGDTLHVVPHNKTLMTTKPANGIYEVSKWAVFPSESQPYRQIIANITLQCPDGMRCGAWDYIDHLRIRRQGGANTPVRDIEIVRVLTPYGGWFGDKWQFTWQQDVTDWGVLLRDSVEMVYQHTGFETDKVGWLVTVDFEIITGTPVMEPLGFDSLWVNTNSFAYGFAEKPFETLVTPRTLTPPNGTRYINARILQTGHGMDRPGNCSEFCSRWREISFDDKLIDHKYLFNICGNNPVFPQAGTWIHARANWCPGVLAAAEVYTLKADKQQHKIAFNMEPYTADKPQGGWCLSSYAFYYKAPANKNDATLIDIISPSTKDAYKRENPITHTAKIRVKNNGENDLESLKITYGFKGAKKKFTHLWRGNIPFLGTDTIVLPCELAYTNGVEVFEVTISQPNGKTDRYAADNSLQSLAHKPITRPAAMRVDLFTNNDSTETSWIIADSKGNVLYSQSADTLKAKTLYSKTVELPAANYTFTVTDTKNNGLSFWGNRRGEYGYLRLYDQNNELIKNFEPNFGTAINEHFIVSPSVEIQKNSVAPERVFEFWSPRTNGPAFADIVVEKPQNITLNFYDEQEQIQWTYTVYNYRNQGLKLDLSHLPLSFYRVQMVLENGDIVTQWIRRVE